MKQTIILKDGVATMGTENMVSNAELLERLEIAEEVIQLREEVKGLRATNAELEANAHAGVYQLDKLALTEGDLVLLPEDIDDSAIQMLVNHVRDTLGIQNISFVMGDLATASDEDKAQLVAEQIETRVAATRRELVDTKQENQQLHDYNAELQKAGDQLGVQLDDAKEDNRVMAINLTTTERKLEDALTAKAELEKQVKELKKLDPERLQKQVKELKKSNKEKQESIEALRKQNHELVKDNNSKAEEVKKLDKALDKACDEINQNNTPEALEEYNCGPKGHWKVFGTPSIENYDVLDVKNNVSMRVHVKDGILTCPEVRTPPKTMQQALIVRADRYAATEKSIAENQKPLEQGKA